MVTLYYMSGSPYSWRVWLTLEHKHVPHEVRTLSYDAGDFDKPELGKLNPRRRVPVIVDDGFVLYESAAIVEYLEDKWPDLHVFATDVRARAQQRRMIREADQYFATAMEKLVVGVLYTPKEKQSAEEIGAAMATVGEELATWEASHDGDFLAGALSAVDFTLYPLFALTMRIAKRAALPGVEGLAGPRLSLWAKRMEALPVVQKTWPPHWK
jgi:glutathione S-transferase